jgi:hypothetical protein
MLGNFTSYDADLFTKLYEMISIFFKRKLFPMLLTITLWDNLNFTSYDADLFTKLYEMISIF